METERKKLALVTGASRGVGRAVATSLSRAGYRVIINSRDPSSISSVKEELSDDGHVALVADLSTSEGRANLLNGIAEVAGSKGLHVFVHCASATPDPDNEMLLQTTSDDNISDHMLTTALPAAYLLRGLRDLFSAAKSSHAILIGTDWAVPNTPGPPIFSASKSYAQQIWSSSRAEYLKLGCVLSTIVAGNIASFDKEWREAKWTIDDKLEDIYSELGNSRIPLATIAECVKLILSAPLSAVTRIEVVPSDPEYTP